MAEYIEYHPLKFWLDPASIAEIVAHIQTYLVNNPINSSTEIETIIHDYLIAHPEIIGGVRSINGETGEVVLTADNISGGENVTIKDVLDSLQDQIDDIVASIPSDYQQLINDVSDLKSAVTNLDAGTANTIFDNTNILLHVPETSYSYTPSTGTYRQNVIGEFNVTPGQKYTIYRGSVSGELLTNDIIFSQFNGDTKINDVQLAKTTLFTEVTAARNATKIQIRQLVTLASRPETTGTMTTRNVIACSGTFMLNPKIGIDTSDIEQDISEVAGDVADISDLLTDHETTKSGYSNISSFIANTNTAIVKSTELVVPQGKILGSLIYNEADYTVSKVVWILDANNVVIDKINYTAASNGLQTIAINKKYNTDVYIAISGKGHQLKNVGTTEPSSYWSLGIYQSYNVDKNVGDTLPFSQTAATNYYEVYVAITIIEEGLSTKVDNLENGQDGSEIDLNAFPIPKHCEITGNVSYFGRWFDKTIDGNSYKCTNTDGASFAFQVSGANSITVELKAITPPINTPYFAYSIDGGAFTRQLISNTSVSLPDTNEHFVWIVVDGMGEIDPAGSSKWSGTIGIYLKTLSGGTITAVDFRAKNIYFIGDSIVEGINALGTGATASTNSATAGFAFKTARRLNSVPLLCGYGGTGVLAASSFHKAIEAIEYNANGVKVNPMKPDIIVLEHGANDGYAVSQGTYTTDQFIAAYNEVIEALYAKYGCPIICLVPFAQWLRTEIEGCADAHSYCFCVETQGWGVETTDGTHPTATGGTTAALKLSDAITKIFGKTFFM